MDKNKIFLPSLFTIEKMSCKGKVIFLLFTLEVRFQFLLFPHLLIGFLCDVIGFFFIIIGIMVAWGEAKGGGRA